MSRCKFEMAWVGQCKTETVGDFCLEHTLTCVSCGLSATHDCYETGSFVCGSPLCDNCEHAIFPDGTNGGIGFYRTCEVPKGFKSHCKKSEQQYKAWYEKEDEIVNEQDGVISLENSDKTAIVQIDV